MNQSDVSQEIEDLNELINTAGWARLLAIAERQYGPAYLAMKARELGGNPDPAQAGAKLQMLVAGFEAVGIVLGWPQDRLSKLQKPRAVEER